ncbi:hypothetical protein [Leifsonia shinshuensis]|uniref:hypothetical protein n=1 Tax=Leifsonia TaxID=110932 RepID=UPI00285BBB50|nr:hypothetical protein [Leifsonia shinshuensis]MDR6972540.1 hypothetical protein [Leifsonia shinshuensis]
MQSASAPLRPRGRRSAGRRAAVPSQRVRIRLPKGKRRPVLPLRHRVGVTLAVIGLVCGFSIVPTDDALASTLRIAPDTTLAPAAPGEAPVAAPPQHLLVDATIAAPVVNRENLSATDGLQTLARVGTNEAWAKLVLMFGGWPQTDANVTVMLRWMRQENGPPDWWNRNNPLNNGYGSGGGAGLGSYPDLITAAEYCAKNLQRGYPEIVAGLEAGTSADTTAAAIWASPWATSHYGNGTHWSTRPVEIVQAPSSAWGL